MTPILLSLGLILLVALALVLRRRWVTPVRHLAQVAERLAGGDWAARARVSGAQDPRALAGRLNLLAATAQRQMSELDHRRSDLQQLVDSLPDPVLLSDSLGRVILINTAAAKILQISPEEALERKFVHVVNDAQILELFESLAVAPVQQREIRISRGGQRHYYQGVGTRTKAGGVLIVLRNVTTMASAIQMKTDFVANASHELRTPIAAIKIAFETLSEVYQEDPETTRRCIEIIAGHLSRLEEMLRDLLDLSRVETAELKPQVGPVSVAALFARIRQGLGPMARQKEIDLRLEGDEELTFHSDQRLLDLTLKNLVENSIKFTPARGKVSVSIRRIPAAPVADSPSQSGPSGRNGQIEMVVADTGIGIPPEHLERVFERFYQVDASRTGGANRGTGLGLAIVKHAIHALGGSVDLQSTPGRGTTVTCLVQDATPH
ncbi:MAG: ATP-binding protein [Phycisphaerae bacterium]|nr:ATP-binding protein [Phycisphaerae bacterium]MDW8263338.1 ATP-binding protein [Phycisphaerales bacterium]